MGNNLLYAIVVEDCGYGTLIECQIYDDLDKAAKALDQAQQRSDVVLDGDVRANMYWVHLNSQRGLRLRGDGVEDNIDYLARLHQAQKWSRHKRWLKLITWLSTIRLRLINTGSSD